MAMLDQFLGVSPWGSANPTFEQAFPVPISDETAAVEEAAQEAARRQKRGVRHTPAPLTGAEIPGLGLMGSVGMLSPGSSAAPGGSFIPNEAPAGEQMPPSANDPLAREPEVFSGGVPLPRPRPVTPNTPASVAPTDVSSANAAPPGAPMSLAPPAAPGAVEAPQAQGGGIGGVLSGLLKPENAPLFLSLAGGFSGAGSLGTGMRRAFAGATPAAMQLQQQQQLQTTQGATYRALIAKGVPPADAIAAVRDPNIMKATAAKYFETKPFTIHDVKDPLGGSTPVVFDPNKGAFQDMAGKPVVGTGSGPAGTGGTGAPQLLAPGVKFDATLTGDDYLNQYSPEVKAAVKAYMSGDVMPSGNPRMQGIANFAKTVATKYGQDMGIPVSDSMFSEKRKYRMELGSNTANSAGGQAKAFNQAVEHADALATQLEKLGNVDPVGIPAVSRGLNTAREAFSTKQADVANQARTIGQTLAGEVGKLFSGQAGGGVHERELTRNRFNTVNSPRELAGALEGTLETMEGGLRALEQRRDQVLGPNSNVNFVNKETHEKVARIRDVIKRLRGEAPAATAAPPSGKTGTGVQWIIVQ